MCLYIYICRHIEPHMHIHTDTHTHTYIHIYEEIFFKTEVGKAHAKVGGGVFEKNSSYIE